MGNKNNTPKAEEGEEDEDDENFQELSQYNFPIESLIFEGGGMKGLAYVGVVEALHKSGVLKNIKRFAGVSSGAVTAALLAIGYTDISMLVKGVDLMDLIGDDTCLSFLPGILKHFGWHQAVEFQKAVNMWIEAKTGDASITFKQLYDKSNVELCILAVNINYGILEYLHPKTTPDLEIREAMRMAVSVPGYVRPFRTKIDGVECHYVDAGIVSNLPINSFDGWWLSMEPENSFIRKLNPIDKIPEILFTRKRFAERNMKTVAFQVYSDDEDDHLRYYLDQRPGIEDIPYPDTSIARSYLEKYQESREYRQGLLEKYELFKCAYKKLFKALNESGFVKEGKLKATELKTILSDEDNLTKEDFQLLFSTDDVDAVVDQLDWDGDGQIIYSDFLYGVEEFGGRILYKFAGYKYIKTTNWKSHVNAIYRTQQYYLKNSILQFEDIDRVVGINTGYITTLTCDMVPEDKKYIAKKGRMATVAFLKHLINKEVATKEDQPDSCQKRETIKTS